MPIPDYQTIMRPILHFLSTTDAAVLRAIESAMADEHDLNANEREELLPSGTQRVLLNRIGWSLSYLTKAGLTERTGKGRYRITPKGSEILRSNEQIDARFLRSLGGFEPASYKPPLSHPPSLAPRTPASEPGDSLLTPEEQMENGFQSTRQKLVEDVRERLRATSPSRFEQLVVELLVAMGYGGASGEAGQVIGKTGDDGIDGVIKEDKLGLDHVYIQAKRWESNVSRPTVQAFAGSLEGQRARKGVMITTSDFTKDARDYVNRIEKRIVLIDGDLLANYMIDHQIGVTTIRTYELKRIDNDYFEEG